MCAKHAAAQIKAHKCGPKIIIIIPNLIIQPSDINLPTIDVPKTPPPGTPIYLPTISASKIRTGTPINLPPNISPNVYLMYMQ